MRNEMWATRSQCKRALHLDTAKSDAGGYVLYHENGRNYSYIGEGNCAVLGVPGTGKSRRQTTPSLLSCINARESFAITDPKGEHERNTAYLLPPEYRKFVIDFRHIFESQRWNPLFMPYEMYTSGNPEKKQQAMEIVEDLAHALYPIGPKEDPFWPQSARSLFLAVVYALFEVAQPDEINMSSVFQMIIRGDERFATSTYLKEFVNSLPKDSPAAMQLHSYITSANDTRGGIRSVFLEGISMFARSEGLVQMLGADDLHINDLDGETPTAIYIIIPDETPIFDSLAGVLMGQLMNHYIRMAQDRYNGTLPTRMNVFLEELGNIGKALPNLPHIMSAGRSRGIRVQLVLQSLSQLTDIYGESKASTIISNADVIVAFRVNHWQTLQELSVKCGEREVETGGRVTREALITPSQLGAMETGQALVLVSGRLKFITWLPDFTEMYDTTATAPYQRPVRTGGKIVHTFDVVSYTKDAKRKQIVGEMTRTGSRAETAHSDMDIPYSGTTPPRRDSASTSTTGRDRGGRTGDTSLEQLMSRIDARVRESEQQTQNPPAFKLMVLYDGSKRDQVAKIIAEALSQDVAEITRTLTDSDDAWFRFPNREAAVAAQQKIGAIGGLAIVGPVRSGD